MQSHDQEVFNKVDFVEESGADFGDTVAQESDTEEAQEGTDDSTYETEEEPTTETETETELDANLRVFLRWGTKQRWRKPSLQSMAELDEISRVQWHFSPNFLLIFLIYLARALAILCKLGENYNCRSKLLGFRNGLDRYLNNPPYKKGIHITTDPAFQQSNQMLDGKYLKTWRSTGSKTSNTTCAIEREDLQRLKESAVITSIQCLVSWQPVFQFCRRGQEEQRNLTKSSFLFLKDETSEWYATRNHGHDETSKTRRGGTLPQTTRNLEECTREHDGRG